MLIDGKQIAKNLEEKLATELLFSSPKKVCFVTFGGNAATEQFVKMKSRVAERVGITVEVEEYFDVTTTAEAVKIIQTLGKRDYHGIVVQLPISAGLDTQAVLDAIPPVKDIDVLGTAAKESYSQGKIDRMPPVARAIREIFEFINITAKGKKIVVAGRGRLVGEPIDFMFKRMKVPHNIVDINTPEAEKLALFREADIIISGMGIPHAIKPNMIKKGAILIDAGTSEQEGKLVGDIDPACAQNASYLTPVPGGIGPITIVSLLLNLV